MAPLLFRRRSHTGIDGANYGSNFNAVAFCHFLFDLSTFAGNNRQRGFIRFNLGNFLVFSNNSTVFNKPAAYFYFGY